MGRFRLLATTLVVLTMMPSCGGDDTTTIRVAEDDGSGGTVTMDVSEDDLESGGSIVIETDEGRAVIGGGDVPDGFPLPLFDLDVVASSTIETDEGSLHQVTVEFPADLFDRVCDDYEAALRDLGLEVMRTDVDQGADGRTMMLFGEADTTGAVINVVVAGDEPTGNATLGWSVEG